MRMRIACLVCGAAILGTSATHANEPSSRSQGIEVGAHIGIAFASLGGSELNDVGVEYSYRMGIAGGGIFSLPITRFFSTQFELDFVSKGFRGETGFTSTSGTQRMSYLEAPILARIAAPVSQVLEPYGYLGPAFGVLLDAEIEFDDGSSLELDRSVKRFDIGLVLGAGTAVNVRDSGALTIDIRYNLGLRNWSTNEASENTVLNRAIYLTVGYRADLATLARLFGRGSQQRGPAEPAATAPEPTHGSSR